MAKKELTPKQKIIIAFGILLAIFALLYFGSPETRQLVTKPTTTAEENLYKLKSVDRIETEEDYMVMTEALLRKQVDPEAVPREYWAINMMWDDDLKPIPQIPKEKFEYWAENKILEWSKLPEFAVVEWTKGRCNDTACTWYVHFAPNRNVKRDTIMFTFWRIGKGKDLFDYVDGVDEILLVDVEYDDIYWKFEEPLNYNCDMTPEEIELSHRVSCINHPDANKDVCPITADSDYVNRINEARRANCEK